MKIDAQFHPCGFQLKVLLLLKAYFDYLIYLDRFQIALSCSKLAASCMDERKFTIFDKITF